MDHTKQKVIAPSPQGGVGVSNAIPRVVGQTDTGYAFLFENTITDQRAFKHFKRSDFNYPQLAKKTVESLSKVGINWLYMTGDLPIDQTNCTKYN